MEAAQLASALSILVSLETCDYEAISGWPSSVLLCHTWLLLTDTFLQGTAADGYPLVEEIAVFVR